MPIWKPCIDQGKDLHKHAAHHCEKTVKRHHEAAHHTHVAHAYHLHGEDHAKHAAKHHQEHQGEYLFVRISLKSRSEN
jgi:hypothetical protein